MLKLIVIVILLLPATAACLAYIVPTLVGMLPRRRSSAQPTHSFLILIPAHNEQHSLPTTLQSLAVLDYPPELVRVVVVADNCTDNTAAVARWGGAACLVRHDPAHRGAGHAVAFGLERIKREPPDVVLILDADSRLNPEALRELDACFAQGADVVQCAVRSTNADAGPVASVAAVEATLDAGRARGLDRLGLSAPLLGTGMVFRHVVFYRAPWNATGPNRYQECARQLRKAGVRVRRCYEAVVSRQTPPALDELRRQRRRWRAAGALLYGAFASVVSMMLGEILWPAVLTVLAAPFYLRAMLRVRLSQRFAKHGVEAPGLVVQQSSLTFPKVGRLDRGDRECSACDNERQAA